MIYAQALGLLQYCWQERQRHGKIIGVEIQKEMAEMASRSVSLNHLEDKIEIWNMDLKNLEERIDKASIDVITVNPPYKKVGSGIKNERDTKAIARHEVCCTLEDVITVSSKLLNTGGAFYMVHRIERLVDVLSEMRKQKLEPKRIRMVHPKSGKAPNLFLVEGIKNARPFLKVEDPIYVYNSSGEYTQTIYQIYHREEKE